jgi:hypothetical protein
MAIEVIVRLLTVTIVVIAIGLLDIMLHRIRLKQPITVIWPALPMEEAGVSLTAVPTEGISPVLLKQLAAEIPIAVLRQEEEQVMSEVREEK